MKRLLPLTLCVLSLCLTSCAKDETLDPSTRTVKEVESHLKAGMTTDELHDYLDTIPVLVSDDIFHWLLVDGSLWTTFEPTDRGLVIVAAKARANAVPNAPVKLSN